MSILKLLENKNKLGHSTFLGYRGNKKAWYDEDSEDEHKPKYAIEKDDIHF